MIATQTDACLGRGRAPLRGLRVHCISNRFGALRALVSAVVLSGCSNLDFESNQLFAKRLDLFGHSGGYTYSELLENRQERTVAANDLVQQNGACAARPVPPQSQSNPAMAPVTTPAADGLLASAIALGMTECDVVYRAGQPSAVQLGRDPNGDRTAVLTFEGGPRPGVYRFKRGQLVELDRAAETAPAPAPAPITKKKPAKNNTAQKKSDQT